MTKKKTGAETPEGTEFYDWQKTLSYGAPLTMVVGARGIGKTFGFRKFCVLEYLKKGTRFIEVFRTKVQAKEAARDYFEKLAAVCREFDGYEFRTGGGAGYIRPQGTKKWQKICYFVALTEYQKAKTMTFVKVRRILLDEFILDRTLSYQRYLPAEFTKLLNLVDTVTRQQAGDGTKPTAVLLGNAIDLINPYFAALGITEPPRAGYTWHKDKAALVHMVPPDLERAEKRKTETLTGMLLGIVENEEEERTALLNDFTVKGADFIDKKAKLMTPLYSLVWRGRELTIWIKKGGGYHARKGIEDQLTGQRRTFYFSKADARIDYTAARRGEESMKKIVNAYAHGALTFDTPATFETFTEIAGYFGLPL